jgi:hypothetical protein
MLNGRRRYDLTFETAEKTKGSPSYEGNSGSGMSIVRLTRGLISKSLELM